MKSLTALTVAAVCLTASLAQAATSFTAPYPSGSSSVIASVGTVSAGEYGYFWSVARGDSIVETFTGTGLPIADQLSLNFKVPYNSLQSPVNWDVKVNGNTVGSWTWSPSDGTGAFSQTYNFAPIVGDTYTIGMYVSNEVPSGWGSITVSYGEATLTSCVPEPSTYMAGLGALGMLAMAWRSRK